jgi:hypothetical protein
MNSPKTMTLAEFRERIWDQLKDLPEDTQIFFGAGDLTFYRVKKRGQKLEQIEFSEVYEVTAS